MATVSINDWDEKNTASVQDPGTTPTGIQKVQLIKVSEGSGTGSGDCQFSSSAWSNVSDKTGIVVTDVDESTTKNYEIAHLDTTANVAYIWVYDSWDRDGTNQVVVALGTGDGTDYSMSGTGGNPWGQTGVSAKIVNHFNDSGGSLDNSDSSGNNNDATINGAVLDTDGQFGGAASFEGVDDSITLGTNTLTGSFTWAMWVRRDASATGTQGLIGRGNESNGNLVLADRSQSGDNDLFFGIYDSGGRQSIIGSPLANDDTWYLLTITLDSASGTCELFVDASSEGTTSVTSFDGTASANHIIGLDANNEFFGEIDEVRIYTEDKSNDWITADYDMSIKGGQTFFSWTGSESTATSSSVTFTADTLIKSLGLTSTFSFDSVIESEESNPMSFDSFVQAQDKSDTFSIDANVQSQDIITSFNADAALLDELSSTFTADALVQIQDESTTFSFDAILTGETSRTFSLDALLQVQDQSVTFSFDAQITQENSAVFTTDALLKAKNLSASLSADTNLKASDNSVTFGADTNVQAGLSSTFSFDAVLKAESLSATFSFDTILDADVPDTAITFCADTVVVSLSARNEVKTRLDDFAQIIDERGWDAKLIRQTTTTDSMGAVTANTETEYTVRTIWQPVTQKDRQLLGQGALVAGSMRAYFKHRYTVNDTVVEVKEGDILKDRNNKRWRIDAIRGEWADTYQVVYKVAVLNSINNDGTSYYDTC